MIELAHCQVNFGKGIEGINFISYRDNTQHFTLLIVCPRMFRQSFQINNYPVVQTSVIILGDV